MQTRGTFPELSSGMKKSSKRMPKMSKSSCSGMGGFGVKGKGPRKHNTAPKTFAGRRAASHAKAYSD